MHNVTYLYYQLDLYINKDSHDHGVKAVLQYINIAVVVVVV